MPEDPRVPRDLDPAALLSDLDGPRELSPELHQRLTDQLLSAAGDATQVMALRPELSSRLSDELRAQAVGPEPAAAQSAPTSSGVAVLDEHPPGHAEGPGLLAELRSRWTIGTTAAAAAVLLVAAVVGIVFHPGAASNNHAAASGRASGGGSLSSGAPLYPNSNGLSATTAPSSSSTSLQSSAAGGAAAGGSSAASGSGATTGSSGDSSSAPGAFAGAAAPAPSPTVSSVSPSQGPVTGGTQVTITGQGLGDATGVHFGSSSATSVTVLSSTEVQAVAPAHLPGTVDVVVVTPQGLSTINSADTYTYTAGTTP